MGQGYRGWPRPKTVLPPSYREATEETLYESGAFVVFGNQLCSRHVFTAKGRRDSGELNSLDYRRRRHAVTDAHGLQAVLRLAALPTCPPPKVPAVPRRGKKGAGGAKPLGASF